MLPSLTAYALTQQDMAEYMNTAMVTAMEFDFRPLGFIGGVFVLASALIYWQNWTGPIKRTFGRIWHPWEMRRMSQKAKESRKRRIADAICNGMEDAFHKGSVSKKDLRHFYKMIGERCDLPDLLRRKINIRPNVEALKESIVKRIVGDVSKVQAAPLPKEEEKPKAKNNIYRSAA